jgi:hypothetical protein
MTDEAKGGWLWVRKKKFIKSQNIGIKGLDCPDIPFVGAMTEVFQNMQYEYPAPNYLMGFSW